MFLFALLLQIFTPIPEGELKCSSPVDVKDPNVLVVVLDDVGREWVGAYDEGPSVSCTPTIDSLADDGLLFRRAYAAPVCSPSRALLQTGQFGFRTGLGKNVTQSDVSGGLDVTIPAITNAVPSHYFRAWRGKWHQSDISQGLAHPLDMGWDTQWGTRGNFGGVLSDPPPCSPPWNYFQHVEMRDGTEACVSQYATTHTTDETIDLMQAVTDPWLIVAAYNAPHGPHHVPPAHLCPDGCDCTEPLNPTTQEEVALMLSALDAELERLLAQVPANTYVILYSDNGTSNNAPVGEPGGCFGADKIKHTVYEGGVRIPMIVTGPTVPHGEIDYLVQSVDIFPTVADLTGGDPSSAIDGVSFAHWLYGNSPQPTREYAYVELFEPNGDPYTASTWDRAATNGDWKLVQRLSFGHLVSEELYDLATDPCETVDLIDNSKNIPEYSELSRAIGSLLAF